MAFKIIGLVAFAVFIILFVYMVWQVSRLRKRTQKELSFEPGVYQGPAGDPRWNGQLPEKVDDYSEPRYVYENLEESADYLPRNGRIVGYRISPDLVIHSRVQLEVNPPILHSYSSRFGGKLLEGEDVVLLQQNWDKVSMLRKKAGDEPLPTGWFWALHQGIPVVVHYQDNCYKDVIGFPGVWYPLILKR